MGSLYPVSRDKITGANTTKTYPELAKLMGVRPEEVVNNLTTKGRVPQEEVEITARILEESIHNSDIIPESTYFPHNPLEGFHSLFEEVPIAEKDGTTAIQPPFFGKEICDLIFH